MQGCRRRPNWMAFIDKAGLKRRQGTAERWSKMGGWFVRECGPGNEVTHAGNEDGGYGKGRCMRCGCCGRIARVAAGTLGGVSDENQNGHVVIDG